MNRLLKTVAIAGTLTLGAGTAWAQAGPPQGSATGGNVPRPGLEKNDPVRMSDNEREARVVLERVSRETRERGESRSTRRTRAVAAEAKDLVVGAEVRDLEGVLIGTIEAVDAAGVQIVSGTSHAKLPAEGFGKNRRGLLVNMTRADFDRQVAAAGAN